MFTGITPKEGFTVHFPDTGFKTGTQHHDAVADHRSYRLYSNQLALSTPRPECDGRPAAAAQWLPFADRESHRQDNV
ncbi:hypothetical protein [Klebsiella quasipneumoniae]|uniref:hypothetical protein n=1 Tax=Klebsiella quasipneumoniae TaxID=1463165 RepID=UPI0038905901